VKKDKELKTSATVQYKRAEGALLAVKRLHMQLQMPDAENPLEVQLEGNKVPHPLIQAILPGQVNQAESYQSILIK